MVRTANETAPQSAKPNIEEVRELVAASRRQVERTIAGQPEERLIAPGPDGWSVKDHLAHLAAWQRSLAALLTGDPRYEAIGLDKERYERSDTDRLNEHIITAHRDESLDAVLVEFRAAYQAVIGLLDQITTADLYLPYRHYQPGEDDPVDPRNDMPVLEWIAGNTWDHEPEHVEMIRTLLAGAPR